MQTEHGKTVFNFTSDPAKKVGASRLSLSSTQEELGYEVIGVDHFGNVIQNFYGHGTNIVADVYNYWDAELPDKRQVFDALTEKAYTGDEFVTIINNKDRKATTGEQYQRIQELRQATDKLHLTNTQHHLKSASAEFLMESGETRRISLFSTGNNSFGAVNVGLGKAPETHELNRFLYAGHQVAQEFNAHIIRPIKETIMPGHSWNKANLAQANLSVVISNPSMQAELQTIRNSIATKGFAHSTENFLMGGPGSDAVSTIIADINSAKTAIDMMSPYLDKPEVIDALIAARESNKDLTIRVMSTNPRSGVATATGGGAGHDVALARLQAAGITVYTPGIYDAFLPHLKGYRVDNRVGAIGSHNITGNAERASFDGFFRRNDEYIANKVRDTFNTLEDGGYVHAAGVGSGRRHAIPKAVQDYAAAERSNFAKGIENPEFTALGIKISDSAESRNHTNYLLLPSRAGSSYHFGVALHNNLMRQAGYHHMVLGERREGVATQMYRTASSLNQSNIGSSQAGMYWAARYDQGLYAPGLGNYLNEHMFMPMGWGRVYKDEVGAIPSFLGMIGKAFDTGYMYYSSIAPDMAMIGQDYSEDAIGYNMLAGGQAGMFERMFEGTAYNVLQAAAAVSLYVTVGQPLALIQAEFMKDRFIGAVTASFQGAGATSTGGKFFNNQSAFNLFGDLSPWMTPGDLSGASVKEAVMRKAAAIEGDRHFYSIDNERLGFIHYQQYVARGRAGYLLERTMKPILVDMINPHTAGSVGSEMFIEKVDSLVKAINDPIDIQFKLVHAYSSKAGNKVRQLKKAVSTYEADIASDWNDWSKRIEVEQAKLNELVEIGADAKAIGKQTDVIQDLNTRRSAAYTNRKADFRKVVDQATVSVKNIGADRSEFIAKKLQDVLYEIPLNPFRWGVFGGHRGKDYMRVGQVFSFYELTQHARKVIIGRGSFSQLIERAKVVDPKHLDSNATVRGLAKNISKQIRSNRMLWGAMKANMTAGNLSRAGFGMFWEALTSEVRKGDGTAKRVLFDLEASGKAWQAVKKGDVMTAIRHTRQLFMPQSRIGQTTATMRDAERAMLKSGTVQLDQRGGIIMLSADEAGGAHMRWLNAVAEYQDEMAKHALTADELYRVGQASVDFRGEKIMAGMRKGSHGVFDASLRMRQRTLGLLGAGMMFGALVLNNVFQSNKGTSLVVQGMVANIAAKEDKSLSVDFSGNRILPTEMIAYHLGMDMMTINTATEIAAGVGAYTLGAYLARNSSYQGFQPYEFNDELIEDVQKRQLSNFKRKQFDDNRLYFFEKAEQAADAAKASDAIDKTMPKDSNGNPIKGAPSQQRADYDSAAKQGLPEYQRMWTLNIDAKDLENAADYDDLLRRTLQRNLDMTDVEVKALQASDDYDEVVRRAMRRNKGASRAVEMHKVNRVSAEGGTFRAYRMKGMLQTYGGKNAIHTFMYASVLVLASQAIKSSAAAMLDSSRETAGAADPLVAAGIVGLASGVMTRNIAVGAIMGIFAGAITGAINKWAGFRIMPLGGAGKKLDTASAQMNASLQNYAMAVGERGKDASEIELLAAFYAKQLSQQRSIFQESNGRYVQSIARQVPLPFIQLAFVERSRGFGFGKDGRMTFKGDFVQKNYAIALQAAPITGFSFSVAMPINYNRNSGVMGWSYDDSGDVNIIDVAMGSARFGAVQALTVGFATMFTGAMGRLLQTSRNSAMKMLSPLGEAMTEASRSLSFLDNLGKHVTTFLNDFIVSNALQVAKHVPTSVLSMGLRISDRVTTTAAQAAGSHNLARDINDINYKAKADDALNKVINRKLRGFVFKNFKTLAVGGIIGYTALQFVYQGILEQENERMDEQDPLKNFIWAIAGFGSGAATMLTTKALGIRVSDYLDGRTNVQMIKYRYGKGKMARIMRATGIADPKKLKGIHKFFRSGAGAYTRTLGLALAASYLITNQEFGLTVSMDRSYKMTPKGDPILDPQTGEVLYEKLPAHQMLVAGMTAITFAGVMSLFGGMGRSNATTLQRYAQLLVDRHGLKAEQLGDEAAHLVVGRKGVRRWLNRLVNFIQAPGIEADAKTILKVMNNQFQEIGDVNNPSKHTHHVAAEFVDEIDELGLSGADTAAAKAELRNNRGLEALQQMRKEVHSGVVEEIHRFDPGVYQTAGADSTMAHKQDQVGEVAQKLNKLVRTGVVQQAKPLHKILGSRMFSKRFFRGMRAVIIAQIAFRTLATKGDTDYTFVDDMLRGFDSHGKFRLSGPNKNLDPRSAIGDALRLFLQVDRYDMKAVEVIAFGRPQNKFVQAQKNMMASRRDIRHLQKTFGDMRDMMIFDDPNAFMSIMGMGGVTFRSGDKGPRINFYFQLQNAGQDISTSVYSMSSAFGFNAMLTGAIEHNLLTEYATKGLTAGHLQPHQLAVMGRKLLQTTSQLHPLKSSQRRRVSSITSDELHTIQKDPLHAMIVKDREKAFANMSWQPTPSLFMNMMRGDVVSKTPAMQRILQAVVTNNVVASDGSGMKALTPNTRNKLISFLLRSKAITGNNFQLTNITNALIYSSKRRSRGNRAESVDFNTDTVWTDHMSMASVQYDYELAPMNAITKAVDTFRQYVLEPLKPVPILNNLVYNPVAQIGAMSLIGVFGLGSLMVIFKNWQVLEDAHEINRTAQATFGENFLDDSITSKKYKVSNLPSAVRGTSSGGMASKVIITKGELRYQLSGVINEASAAHAAAKSKGTDPVNTVVSALERVEDKLNRVFQSTKDLSGRDMAKTASGEALTGLKSPGSLFGLVDDRRSQNLVQYIWNDLTKAEGIAGKNMEVKVDDFKKVVRDNVMEQIEKAADDFLDPKFWKDQKVMIDGEEHFLLNVIDPDYKPQKGGGTGQIAEGLVEKKLEQLQSLWKSEMKEELYDAISESMVNMKGDDIINMASDARFSSKFTGGDAIDQLNIVIKEAMGRLSESSVIQTLKTTLGGILSAEDIGSLNVAQKSIYKMLGVIENFEMPGVRGVGRTVTKAAKGIAGAGTGRTTAFRPSSLRTSAWNSVGQAFKAFGVAMDMAWAFDTFGAFANLGAAYDDPHTTQLDIDMQEKEVGMIAMNAIFGLAMGMTMFKFVLGGAMAAVTAMGIMAIPVVAGLAIGGYALRKPLGQLWNWTTQQAKTKKVGEGFNSAMWAGGDFLGSALGAPGRAAYHLTGSERAAAATVGATGGAAAGLITGIGIMQVLTTGGAAAAAATGAAAASIPFWPVIGALVAAGAIAGGVLMMTAPQTVSNFTTNVRRTLFNLHPMFGPWLATQPYEMLMMQSRFRKNLTNSPFDFGWARSVAKQKYRQRLSYAKDYTNKALASQSLDNYIFGDSGPTSAFKEFVAAQSWSIARPQSAVDDFIMNELKIREQIVSHSTFGREGWEAARSWTGQEKRIKTREARQRAQRIALYLKAERQAQVRTTAQAHHANTGSEVDAFTFTAYDPDDASLLTALGKAYESAQIQASDKTTEVIVTIPNIAAQTSDKAAQQTLDTAEQNTSKQLRQLDSYTVTVTEDGKERYLKIDRETSEVNHLVVDQMNQMASANHQNRVGFLMQHQAFDPEKIKVTGDSFFS